RIDGLGGRTLHGVMRTRYAVGRRGPREVLDEEARIDFGRRAPRLAKPRPRRMMECRKRRRPGGIACAAIMEERRHQALVPRSARSFDWWSAMSAEMISSSSPSITRSSL